MWALFLLSPSWTGPFYDAFGGAKTRGSRFRWILQRVIWGQERGYGRGLDLNLGVDVGSDVGVDVGSGPWARFQG